MTDRLLVFIKNIEPGKVKTRLAGTIGNEKALEVYRYLLEHTRKTALGVNVDRQVWYSSRVEDSDKWTAPEFASRVQAGADLGERMENAFQQAFAEGMQKVVIIGSDCPELSAEHLKSAFAILDEKPAVIGPARDGGYYLLGLSQPIPALFREKTWSTESVYEEAVAELKRLGLEHGELPVLSDVDYEEDLDRLGIRIN